MRKISHCLVLLLLVDLIYYGKSFTRISTHQKLVRVPTLSSGKGFNTFMTSVGIDLGTTYSLISMVNNGSPYIVHVDGKSTMPSVVSFLSNGSTIVGDDAALRGGTDADNTFASVKRIIGKSTVEISKLREKQFASKMVRTTQSDPKGILYCPAQKRNIAPEDVSAEVLKRLIHEAERQLRESGQPSKVTNAVITVPAYFSQAQRAATERAGNLAGLDKVKLLREPEAAAMAYGLNLQQRQLVLVFDLGGGTLDVSVLEVGQGLVEVIATNGDAHLGGDDFDQVIVEWIIDQFAHTEGVTMQMVQQMKGDPSVQARLRDVARDVKQRLSTANEILVEVPNIHLASGLGVSSVLTRHRFESLSGRLLGRLLKPLREVAIMAGINLPGESGRMGLSSEDDQDKITEDESADDEDGYGEFSDGTALEAEGIGGKLSHMNVACSEELRRRQTEGRAGARQRQKLLGSTMKELRRLQRQASFAQPGAPRGDSYSTSAGAGKANHGDTGGGGGAVNLFPSGRAIDAILLVGGATRIPCVRRTVRTVTGVEALSSRTVNPDEAVCLGAGILAGMLDGVIPDMQVLSPWQAAVLRVVQEEKLKGNVLLPLKSANSAVADGDVSKVEQDRHVTSSPRKRRFPSLNKIRSS